MHIHDKFLVSNIGTVFNAHSRIHALLLVHARVFVNSSGASRRLSVLYIGRLVVLTMNVRFKHQISVFV